MLLLAEDVSIQLESLNLNGKPISETHAILQHLDSEQAIIRLHPPTIEEPYATHPALRSRAA